MAWQQWYGFNLISYMIFLLNERVMFGRRLLCFGWTPLALSPGDSTVRGEDY
jgi:hypothetical protein